MQCTCLFQDRSRNRSPETLSQLSKKFHRVGKGKLPQSYFNIKKTNFLHEHFGRRLAAFAGLTSGFENVQEIVSAMLQ